MPGPSDAPSLPAGFQSAVASEERRLSLDGAATLARVAAAGLVPLYAVYTVGHLAVLSGAVATGMALLAATTALLLFALWRWLSRHERRAGDAAGPAQLSL